MRQGYQYSGSSPIPILKWIIISNIIVFVMQSVFVWWIHVPLMENFFSLSRYSLKSFFIWTPISYSFLHDVQNPFHLIFNMFIVFIFGRTIDRDIGSRKLLTLYLFSAITGGIVYLLFNHSGGFLIGASAAAMGLLTLFCILHANETITLLLFFIIPVRVKPKNLLWVVLGVDLFFFLFQELPPGAKTHVAHSAHLGGILGGWLYYKYFMNKDFWFENKSFNFSIPNFFKNSGTSGKPKYKYSVNILNRKDLQKEVDRILDKINSKGFGSLTDEEKKTLDKAKDAMSN